MRTIWGTWPPTPGSPRWGGKLHDVMHLLDEVRAALDEAKEAMEDDAKDAAGFTVARV